MVELSKCVLVWIDGDPVLLPPNLRTLVVLNFPCYQAGQDIWGSGDVANAAGFHVLWSKPSPEDHIIEIVGIGGLDHEAAIRSNMSTGYCLGQGSRIKLSLLEDMAINIDGEPQWQQAPCEVFISQWGSMSVLHKSTSQERQSDTSTERQKKSPLSCSKFSHLLSKQRRKSLQVASECGCFSLGGFLLYVLTGLA